MAVFALAVLVLAALASKALIDKRIGNFLALIESPAFKLGELTLAVPERLACLIATLVLHWREAMDLGDW